MGGKTANLCRVLVLEMVLVLVLVRVLILVLVVMVLVLNTVLVHVLTCPNRVVAFITFLYAIAVLTSVAICLVYLSAYAFMIFN